MGEVIYVDFQERTRITAEKDILSSVPEHIRVASAALVVARLMELNNDSETREDVFALHRAHEQASASVDELDIHDSMVAKHLAATEFVALRELLAK